jgi:predicted alpha/beta-hydrolase family hydrolase
MAAHDPLTKPIHKISFHFPIHSPSPDGLATPMCQARLSKERLLQQQQISADPNLAGCYPGCVKRARHARGRYDLPSRLAVFLQPSRSSEMATTTLTIQGYSHDLVPNRFLRPEGAINHLAVLLPGFGYTLDMPLFYYAQHLLLDRGWDVLRVEYAYNNHPEFQTLPAPERERWLLADSEAAWRAGLGQRTYQRVVLIGKSLGTRAMGHLLTMADPPPNVGAVWLTPLLGEERLRHQIRQYGGPSLFVIGTADPHFEPVALEQMQVATIGEAVVVRDADHGMDIPGDPIASVRAVERVVEALGRFLA